MDELFEDFLNEIKNNCMTCALTIPPERCWGELSGEKRQIGFLKTKDTMIQGGKGTSV